jgi:O-antigen ligase
MQKTATEPHQIASRVGLRYFQGWTIAIWLMAALPTIFVFSTWDYDGIQSSAAFAVRYLSLPITIGELCILLLAMRSSFSIGTTFRELSLVAKLLISIWALFAILAVILSGQPLPLLILTTIRYALHAVFLASCIHLATNADGADRNSGLSILAFGAVAYVGFLAIFAITVPNKADFPWMLRLPTGTNIRQIGYFAAIASVAPISLLLFGRTKILLFSIVVTTLVAFTAWTGSRGALAGLFIGIAIAVVAYAYLPKLSRAFALSGSVAGGLAISLLIPNPSPQFGLLRIASSMAQEDVSNGRSILWNSTFTQILKAPWIGHGSGSFNQNMREIHGFDFNHPHQFLLQYVYDWGLIGGFAGALLLLLLYTSCLQRARQTRDASGYAAVCVLSVTIVVAMIDGALFYPFSIFLALAIVACNFVNDAPSSDKKLIGVTK